jgi:hypothetical protein
MLSSMKPTLHLSASWPLPKPDARASPGGNQTVSSIPQIAHPTSTAERWASYVLGVCKSDKDPRTLGIWAHEVAVSYTTLCESCRLIEVPPRSARDFSRVLRLMFMPSFEPRTLASFLDVSDRRTLDAILHKAGFGQSAAFSGPVSVVCFLDNQEFVARENAGLKIIRNILEPYLNSP